MQNVLRRLSRKIFFWGDRLGIHILPKHSYTPIPDYSWLRAHRDGAAAYVVLASTHERALDIVPLAALQEHAIDVPSSPGALEE